MMKKKVIAVLAPGLFIMAAGCRPMKADYPLDASYTRNAIDDSFLTGVTRWHIATADMANLAEGKSGNSLVKSYASRIRTRTQAEQERIASLAQGAVTLPSEAAHAHHVSKSLLNAMDSDNFDSSYLRHQQSILTRTIELYKDELKHGQFKNIIDHAAKKLPDLLSEQQFADSVLHEL